VVGSSVGVFVEMRSVQLDWCARRSVGERKMWGQVEQQQVQPMALRVVGGRDVRSSRWRWWPWVCAMAMPVGSWLKMFVPPL